jgi:hypothetical protein
LWGSVDNDKAEGGWRLLGASSLLYYWAKKPNLDMTPEHRQQGRNRQTELYQGKKLLQGEGKCQQRKKTTYRMGGNICKPYI